MAEARAVVAEKEDVLIEAENCAAIHSAAFLPGHRDLWRMN
jgi:hypothetical protein